MLLSDTQLLVFIARVIKGFALVPLKASKVMQENVTNILGAIELVTRTGA